MAGKYSPARPVPEDPQASARADAKVRGRAGPQIAVPCNAAELSGVACHSPALAPMIFRKTVIRRASRFVVVHAAPRDCSATGGTPIRDGRRQIRLKVPTAVGGAHIPIKV